MNYVIFLIESEKTKNKKKKVYYKYWEENKPL